MPLVLAFAALGLYWLHRKNVAATGASVGLLPAFVSHAPADPTALTTAYQAGYAEGQPAGFSQGKKGASASPAPRTYSPDLPLQSSFLSGFDEGYQDGWAAGQLAYVTELAKSA